MNTHAQYVTTWFVSCNGLLLSVYRVMANMRLNTLLSHPVRADLTGSFPLRTGFDHTTFEMSGRNRCGSGSEPGARVPPPGTWDLSNTGLKFPVNVFKKLFCTACSVHWNRTKYSLFVTQNQSKTGISLQVGSGGFVSHWGHWILRLT
jgi:hypothetical protein